MHRRSPPISLLQGALGALLALTACSAPAPEPAPLATEAAPTATDPTATASAALSQCVTVQRGAYGVVTDTYLNSAYPGDHSSGAYPAVYTGSNGSGEKQALVRFELEFLPPHALIETATFTVNQTYRATASDVRVHRATAAWSEAATSWNSFAAAFDPAVVGVLHTTSGFGPRSLDVTALVQQWTDGTVDNHGLLLEEDLTSTTQWRSSEANYVTERPALTVCWTDPTCSPACAGPGEVCELGQCVVNCTAPEAVPCDEGTVCNVGEGAFGACVPPSDPCVVSGTLAACGDQSCGPGAACDTAVHQCVPALPCTDVACDDGVCHGTGCGCDRPPPTCAPAPLANLNTSAFRNALADLKFDATCNAWGVTMLSGTDYLRRMTPAGIVTSFAGSANLNMGEVAIAQGDTATFGPDGIEVALTYICCASCGCAANPPQGVGRWNPPTNNLPNVAPATSTTGTGPFGSVHFDTGPAGLAWGLDDQLYIGNLSGNGTLSRLDPQTYTRTNFASMGSRVYGTAPIDGSRLLVALANRQIRLFDMNTGTSILFATTAQDVTGMVRDPWNGRVYVALRGGAIREFSGAGDDLGLFAQGQGSGRITIAGDDHLYFVSLTTGAAIQRWTLPATF
ncbi:DNRLRE domain-containing protein [Chondromyces crocatus]|uniref:Carbohydrate-binding module family 96 domain-containing protein n=1 Tax=Chondromyces crocatus TaxID=52 RepID=A0A0K1EJR5_CHOCO|nr:DNRLRE domain-containing protein [Chondromyces crocatus]AKT41089.1 uncharacterized protein CMC5_052480 [Chondromyces crocatus]